MARKQDERAPVASIAVKQEAARLRDAALVAEAICQDFPSTEARALIDAEHSEAQAVERDGGLLGYALDSALTGNSLGYVTTSAIKLRAAQFKQGLGYADASPAEQMLIEHVVLCHARLGVVEWLHALATQGAHNRDAGLYWEQRLTMAQKRFDRAMITFARTRALLARADAARAQATAAEAKTGPRAVRAA